MKLNKLIVAAALACGVVTGVAGAPAADASSNLISIKIYNDTGADVGIITPWNNHGTRATGYVEMLYATDTVQVPAGGFAVVYGNTCLRIPGSMGPNSNTAQVQSDNGFTLTANVQYDLTLGTSAYPSLEPLIKFNQHNDGNNNDVFMYDQAPVANCAGL